MFSVLSVALWLTLAGQVADIPPTTAKDFYGQGMVRLRTQLYGDARESFQKAIAMQPAYPEAHQGLGETLIGIGLHEKAVAAFSKAIELKPDYAEAYAHRGRACFNIGREMSRSEERRVGKECRL